MSAGGKSLTYLQVFNKILQEAPADWQRCLMAIHACTAVGVPICSLPTAAIFQVLESDPRQTWACALGIASKCVAEMSANKRTDLDPVAVNAELQKFIVHACSVIQRRQREEGSVRGTMWEAALAVQRECRHHSVHIPSQYWTSTLVPEWIAQRRSSQASETAKNDMLDVAIELQRVELLHHEIVSSQTMEKVNVLLDATNDDAAEATIRDDCVYSMAQALLLGDSNSQSTGIASLCSAIKSCPSGGTAALCAIREAERDAVHQRGDLVRPCLLADPQVTQAIFQSLTSSDVSFEQTAGVDSTARWGAALRFLRNDVLKGNAEDHSDGIQCGHSARLAVASIIVDVFTAHVTGVSPDVLARQSKELRKCMRDLCVVIKDETTMLISSSSARSIVDTLISLPLPVDPLSNESSCVDDEERTNALLHSSRDVNGSNAPVLAARGTADKSDGAQLFLRGVRRSVDVMRSELLAASRHEHRDTTRGDDSGIEVWRAHFSSLLQLLAGCGTVLSLHHSSHPLDDNVRKASDALKSCLTDTAQTLATVTGDLFPSPLGLEHQLHSGINTTKRRGQRSSSAAPARSATTLQSLAQWLVLLHLGLGNELRLPPSLKLSSEERHALSRCVSLPVGRHDTMPYTLHWLVGRTVHSSCITDLLRLLFGNEASLKSAALHCLEAHFSAAVDTPASDEQKFCVLETLSDTSLHGSRAGVDPTGTECDDSYAEASSEDKPLSGEERQRLQKVFHYCTFVPACYRAATLHLIARKSISLLVREDAMCPTSNSSDLGQRSVLKSTIHALLHNEKTARWKFALDVIEAAQGYATSRRGPGNKSNLKEVDNSPRSIPTQHIPRLDEKVRLELLEVLVALRRKHDWKGAVRLYEEFGLPIVRSGEGGQFAFAAGRHPPFAEVIGRDMVLMGVTCSKVATAILTAAAMLVRQRNSYFDSSFAAEITVDAAVHPSAAFNSETVLALAQHRAKKYARMAFQILPKPVRPEVLSNVTAKVAEIMCDEVSAVTFLQRHHILDLEKLARAKNDLKKALSLCAQTGQGSAATQHYHNFRCSFPGCSPGFDEILCVSRLLACHLPVRSTSQLSATVAPNDARHVVLNVSFSPVSKLKSADHITLSHIVYDSKLFGLLALDPNSPELDKRRGFVVSLGNVILDAGFRHDVDFGATGNVEQAASEVAVRFSHHAEPSVSSLVALVVSVEQWTRLMRLVTKDGKKLSASLELCSYLIHGVTQLHCGLEAHPRYTNQFTTSMSSSRVYTNIDALCAGARGAIKRFVEDVIFSLLSSHPMTLAQALNDDGTSTPFAPLLLEKPTLSFIVERCTPVVSASPTACVSLADAAADFVHRCVASHLPSNSQLTKPHEIFLVCESFRRMLSKWTFYALLLQPEVCDGSHGNWKSQRRVLLRDITRLHHLGREFSQTFHASPLSCFSIYTVLAVWVPFLTDAVGSLSRREFTERLRMKTSIVSDNDEQELRAIANAISDILRETTDLVRLCTERDALKLWEEISLVGPAVVEGGRVYEAVSNSAMRLHVTICTAVRSASLRSQLWDSLDSALAHLKAVRGTGNSSNEQPATRTSQISISEVVEVLRGRESMQDLRREIPLLCREMLDREASTVFAVRLQSVATTLASVLILHRCTLTHLLLDCGATQYDSHRAALLGELESVVSDGVCDCDDATYRPALDFMLTVAFRCLPVTASESELYRMLERPSAIATASLQLFSDCDASPFLLKRSVVDVSSLLLLERFRAANENGGTLEPFAEALCAGGGSSRWDLASAAILQCQVTLPSASTSVLESLSKRVTELTSMFCNWPFVHIFRFFSMVAHRLDKSSSDLLSMMLPSPLASEESSCHANDAAATMLIQSTAYLEERRKLLRRVLEAYGSQSPITSGACDEWKRVEHSEIRFVSRRIHRLMSVALRSLNVSQQPTQQPSPWLLSVLRWDDPCVTLSSVPASCWSVECVCSIVASAHSYQCGSVVIQWLALHRGRWLSSTSQQQGRQRIAKELLECVWCESPQTNASSISDGTLHFSGALFSTGVVAHLWGRESSTAKNKLENILRLPVGTRCQADVQNTTQTDAIIAKTTIQALITADAFALMDSKPEVLSETLKQLLVQHSAAIPRFVENWTSVLGAALYYAATAAAVMASHRLHRIPEYDHLQEVQRQTNLALRFSRSLVPLYELVSLTSLVRLQKEAGWLPPNTGHQEDGASIRERIIGDCDRVQQTFHRYLSASAAFIVSAQFPAACKTIECESAMSTIFSTGEWLLPSGKAWGSNEVKAWCTKSLQAAAVELGEASPSPSAFDLVEPAFERWTRAAETQWAAVSPTDGGLNGIDNAMSLLPLQGIALRDDTGFSTRMSVLARVGRQSEPNRFLLPAHTVNLHIAQIECKLDALSALDERRFSQRIAEDLVTIVKRTRMLCFLPFQVLQGCSAVYSRHLNRLVGKLLFTIHKHYSASNDPELFAPVAKAGMGLVLDGDLPAILLLENKGLKALLDLILKLPPTAQDRSLCIASAAERVLAVERGLAGHSSTLVVRESVADNTAYRNRRDLQNMTIFFALALEKLRSHISATGDDTIDSAEDVVYTSFLDFLKLVEGTCDVSPSGELKEDGNRRAIGISIASPVLCRILSDLFGASAVQVLVSIEGAALKRMSMDQQSSSSVWNELSSRQVEQFWVQHCSENPLETPNFSASSLLFYFSGRWRTSAVPIFKDVVTSYIKAAKQWSSEPQSASTEAHLAPSRFAERVWACCALPSRPRMLAHPLVALDDADLLKCLETLVEVGEFRSTLDVWLLCEGNSMCSAPVVEVVLEACAAYCTKMKVQIEEDGPQRVMAAVWCVLTKYQSVALSPAALVFLIMLQRDLQDLPQHLMKGSHFRHLRWMLPLVIAKHFSATPNVSRQIVLSAISSHMAATLLSATESVLTQRSAPHISLLELHKVLCLFVHGSRGQWHMALVRILRAANVQGKRAADILKYFVSCEVCTTVPLERTPPVLAEGEESCGAALSVTFYEVIRHAMAASLAGERAVAKMLWATHRAVLTCAIGSCSSSPEPCGAAIVSLRFLQACGAVNEGNLVISTTLAVAGQVTSRKGDQSLLNTLWSLATDYIAELPRSRIGHLDATILESFVAQFLLQIHVHAKVPEGNHPPTVSLLKVFAKHPEVSGNQVVAVCSTLPTKTVPLKVGREMLRKLRARKQFHEMLLFAETAALSPKRDAEVGKLLTEAATVVAPRAVSEVLLCLHGQFAGRSLQDIVANHEAFRLTEINMHLRQCMLGGMWEEALQYAASSPQSLADQRFADTCFALSSKNKGRTPLLLLRALLLPSNTRGAAERLVSMYSSNFSALVATLQAYLSVASAHLGGQSAFSICGAFCATSLLCLDPDSLSITDKDLVDEAVQALQRFALWAPTASAPFTNTLWSSPTEWAAAALPVSSDWMDTSRLAAVSLCEFFDGMVSSPARSRSLFKWMKWGGEEMQRSFTELVCRYCPAAAASLTSLDTLSAAGLTTVHYSTCVANHIVAMVSARQKVIDPAATTHAAAFELERHRDVELFSTSSTNKWVQALAAVAAAQAVLLRTAETPLVNMTLSAARRIVRLSYKSMSAAVIARAYNSVALQPSLLPRRNDLLMVLVEGFQLVLRETSQCESEQRVVNAEVVKLLKDSCASDGATQLGASTLGALLDVIALEDGHQLPCSRCALWRIIEQLLRKVNAIGLLSRLTADTLATSILSFVARVAPQSNAVSLPVDEQSFWRSANASVVCVLRQCIGEESVMPSRSLTQSQTAAQVAALLSLLDVSTRLQPSLTSTDIVAQFESAMSMYFKCPNTIPLSDSCKQTLKLVAIRHGKTKWREIFDVLTGGTLSTRSTSSVAVVETPVAKRNAQKSLLLLQSCDKWETALVHFGNLPQDAILTAEHCVALQEKLLTAPAASLPPTTSPLALLTRLLSNGGVPSTEFIELALQRCLCSGDMRGASELLNTLALQLRVPSAGVTVLRGEAHLTVPYTIRCSTIHLVAQICQGSSNDDTNLDHIARFVKWVMTFTRVPKYSAEDWCGILSAFVLRRAPSNAAFLERLRVCTNMILFAARPQQEIVVEDRLVLAVVKAFVDIGLESSNLGPNSNFREDIRALVGSLLALFVNRPWLQSRIASLGCVALDNSTVSASVSLYRQLLLDHSSKEASALASMVPKPTSDDSSKTMGRSANKWAQVLSLFSSYICHSDNLDGSTSSTSLLPSLHVAVDTLLIEGKWRKALECACSTAADPTLQYCCFPDEYVIAKVTSYLDFHRQHAAAAEVYSQYAQRGVSGSEESQLLVKMVGKDVGMVRGDKQK